MKNSIASGLRMHSGVTAAGRLTAGGAQDGSSAHDRARSASLTSLEPPGYHATSQQTLGRWRLTTRLIVASRPAWQTISFGHDFGCRRIRANARERRISHVRRRQLRPLTAAYDRPTTDRRRV